MMRDVMQNAGLEGFAELGILIFFVTFAIVALRVLARGDRWDEHASLPLEEGKEVSR